MDPSEALRALSDERVRADPYPCYETLRGFGPVVAADAGVVVLVGYAECRRGERSAARAGFRVYVDWAA
ncbi:MAG TPA: hypothetical protein VJT31_37110 [Rugosimonospora sp.]|nr:hypothetical protein [Rugosimonospora sp.]